MRGSAAFRAAVAPGGVLAGPWVRNELWRRARAVPSLDLRFADDKSLLDAVTRQSLVTFTRASSATFIDSAGTLQTAAVDVPRFDHNPTTAESLGLLVEEQRTNSLTYSEDTSQWLTPTNITLSQNQTTAPDGASTADQYLETAATGLHVQDGMPFTFVTSTAYTYSVFVKSIGGRNFEIGYPPTTFTNRFARFNLSGSGSVQGSDAGVTASIQAYANGWYRCSATNTCALGASARISNFANNDSFARSYAGDVTKGLFIWGAQLEAGAFPTSYIPTTTAAATRSADVASITGANFSSWYLQGTGSIFMKYILQNTTAAYSARFDNGSANDSVQFIANANGANINVSGVAQYSRTSIPFAVNQIRVQCLAYELNNVNSVFDGMLGVNDSLATIPTVNQLVFVGHVGPIARLTYWPQRLPNSTLVALTQ
jgi:hypothetical protein